MFSTTWKNCLKYKAETFGACWDKSRTNCQKTVSATCHEQLLISSLTFKEWSESKLNSTIKYYLHSGWKKGISKISQQLLRVLRRLSDNCTDGTDQNQNALCASRLPKRHIDSISGSSMDHSRNFQGINKHCTTKSKATANIQGKKRAHL